MSGTFTITNVMVLAEEASIANRRYDVVNVVVQDAVIKAIAKGAAPLGEVVDGTNKLLLPGFVNGHTHSSEMWARGLVDPLPLELWLTEIIEVIPEDPEALYLSAKHTAIETLQSGGTTILDHVSLTPGNELACLDAVVRAYREVGIRAIVAPLVFDLEIHQSIGGGPAVTNLAEQHKRTKSIVDWMTVAVEKYHRPTEGIIIGVGPTGIQRCSDELFQGLTALSTKHNLPRHSHVLETKQQLMLSHGKFHESAVQHLNKIGFLNHATTCAHAIWFTEKDMEILKHTRSTIVHNPLSNLRLGSGICPLLKYREHGVTCAIGCDGAASNDSQDLLEAVKLATVLQNITTFDYRQWLSAYDTVKMASQGGATGLGMQSEFGSITVGKKADFVMYELKKLCMLPRTDPLMMLILGRPVNVLHSSWVNGRRVIANHVLTTADVEKFQEELWMRQEWLINERKPKCELRRSVEAQYRTFMELPK